MTAEIAIINRSAVALAADSMASNLGSAKNYPTAKKIMALSEDPPIAAMFYGSGSFGPYPWDTIVQLYTTKRQKIRFGTVTEYALDFIRHLDGVAESISDDAQISYARSEILWELGDINRIAMQNYALAMALNDSGSDLGLEYFLNVVNDHLSDRIRELQEIGTAKGLSQKSVRQALLESISGWTIFGESIDSWSHMLKLWLQSREEFAFIDSHALATHLEQKLWEAVLTSLATADWSSRSTGIVIAGVGDEQMLPALEHWLVDGVVAGVVKSRRLDYTEIGDDCTAAILPFAQTDAMNSLVDGIHTNLAGAAISGIREALHEMLDRAEERLSSLRLKGSTLDDTIDALRSDVQQIHAKSVTRLLEARSDYSEQFLDIVSNLPQEHLADMAEALVNVAAFKERFTPGADSVGGPIDVVLLSKGHGLVWASQK